MRFIYSLGIWVYGLGIGVFSIFNQKAYKWIEGRKGWKAKLKKAEIQGAIWIHCASLGEFEQGRPVIEGIRKKHPEGKILITFFSPSGYEIRKNYELADFVCYLPLDTPGNAKAFIEIVDPSLAIFVKYEIWHNFYYQLSKRDIEHYIISAIFRENQIYFKPSGKWFLKTLTRVTKIFTQDQTSLELLKSAGIAHVQFTGDTRFDRVFEISRNRKSISIAEQFSKDAKTLVAGSTWPQDEKFLGEALMSIPKLKLIIAPHEVDQKHIHSLKKIFPNYILLSDLTNDLSSANALIIDEIGLLSSLYAYGDMAYIGGGFGSGIHNSLEPACYGIPVIFGPRFQKFKEARDLVSIGGAFTFQEETSLIQTLSTLIDNDSKRENAGSIAGNYVEENRGATAVILSEIIGSPRRAFRT